MGPTATSTAGFCVVGTAVQSLKIFGVLVRYLRLFLLHYSKYLIGGLSSTTKGATVDVVGAALVGGGLLKVLPTALEKIAGGPLMTEVDLGPGVALRGGKDSDNGLLCW